MYEFRACIEAYSMKLYNFLEDEPPELMELRDSGREIQSRIQRSFCIIIMCVSS